MSTPSRWAILTGEFPPGSGGVGDYTAQVAAALAAAGDEVTVFRPPPSSSATVQGESVQIVTLPDHYGAAARCMMDAWLDAAGARVLVQYVPQAFGMRGVNLPFCRWLHARFRRGDDIRVMNHEPYLYLSANPRHAAAAAFQRAMAAILLRSSRRVYLSTDAWMSYLRPYAPRPFHALTLPIPSAIPAVHSPVGVAKVRATLSTAPNGRVVGHFGTYGAHIAPVLRAVTTNLLRSDRSLSVVCIGGRSDEFARDLVRSAPALAGRMHGTGRLDAEDVSIYLQACDVVVQPYPDGVTTRRTSVMAALANGRPVVTTDGPLTEPVWRKCDAVQLVPCADPAALVTAVEQFVADEQARLSQGRRAASAYAAHFALENSLPTLRDPAATP